jgi:hypothetical protein
MHVYPAYAGLYNRTFSPEQGEKVFLCPEMETKHSALSNRPRVMPRLTADRW